MHAPSSLPAVLSEILEPRTLLAATPPGLFRPRPLDGPALNVTLGIWHTYAQATADLQSFASNYPNLAKLVSIGKTVQNRDIWALQISDNVGVDEDEPEFMYQGAIHGDEPIGMENSFYLINDLLTGYGTNTRYTNLVNNMDLWFVPNMNWDGYVASSPSVGHRGNANNIDLNRNFPEWTTRSFSTYTRYFGAFGNMYDGPAPQTALLQPETVAMMNFMRQHNFVASATFHSGDLVVNYPWDTDGSSGATYAVAPDDALFKSMALVYSTPNTPMYNNNSFPFVHGTTNGDYWYPISGGLQDWANLYTGNHNFTIELNEFTKYPSAAQLPTFWNNNKESMLGYLETANWGVRGLVRDANTDAPLFAKVTLMAPAPSPTPDANHPSSISVYTDPDIGDYHRQLLPGTYTMKFEANGYITQTISGIQVTGNTNDPSATLRLNVNLVPIDNTPPTVSGATFNALASPPSMQITFSEPVQNLDNSDLILTNNTTSTTVPSSEITLAGYDANSRTATFTFNSGTLAGGSYTASLNSAGVQDLAGNNLAGGFAHDFIYAPGTSGNDSFYIVQGNASLIVWVNADPQTQSPTYTAVFSSLEQLAIDGADGDDTLTLDFAGGDVRPAGADGFAYRLGDDDETLRLIGAGAITYSADPAIDTPRLTLILENGASAAFNALATHLAALHLDGASSATLAAGSARRLVVDDLAVTGNATLDLNDNDLIVYDDSALPAVQSLISTARAGGAWTGSGITSSAAKNHAAHNTTLGAMDSDDFESIYGDGAPFAGEQLARSAVLVKYTYYGDADFNGQVNFDDYSRIDNGFTNARTGWLNGDFDGNGLINFDDYSLIDLAFNTQAAAL